MAKKIHLTYDEVSCLSSNQHSNMEYPDLLSIKKKIITTFLSYREHWDHSLDYIPYRFSLMALRDDLSGIDYKYEREYEEKYHETPSKTDDVLTKIILVQSFTGKNLTSSDIAFVLGYDKDEVGWMLSETGNSFHPDQEWLKSYRDAFAIYKTERDEGFIEGFVKAFIENCNDEYDTAKLNAAQILYKKGYDKKAISHVTGLADTEFE